MTSKGALIHVLGRALEIDAVLDGSIHDNAQQIRVTVRLLRGALRGEDAARAVAEARVV